jgi:glycosyltransferase involved in cell wall biosynthesis
MIKKRNSMGKDIIKKKKVPSVQLSFIISIYNLAEEIDRFYSALLRSAESMGTAFEFIFVDDGSSDASYDKLTSIAGKDMRIKVLRMRTTFGEASALDAGMRYSSGEVIVFISGRVRVNIEVIPSFLDILKQGNDMVVGWRFPRQDSPMNRILSKIFNSIANKMMKGSFHDINSGVFITYRTVLGKIVFYGDLYNFIPILAAQQGYRVVEKKIEQCKGKFRKSKYLREYLQRLLDIVTVFFLSRYSKKPIHFLGFLGTLFIILGFGIELYLFIYRILQVGPIAGRPLLVFGALLLVIGIQMISIGLLGEMIIFTHAGDIEEYNIQEIINDEREQTA